MSLLSAQRRNVLRGGGRIFTFGTVLAVFVLIVWTVTTRQEYAKLSLGRADISDGGHRLALQPFANNGAYNADTAGSSKDTQKDRRYRMLEPRSIAGISQIVGPGAQGISPKMAEYPSDMQYFVKATDKGLTLAGKPFVITGFNNYYMVNHAAWVDEGRKMTDEVFETAKKMGTNTLRIWGFNDGDEWQALQPEMGIIDEAIFREGLDYVVSQAVKHGIRLIITLTNYEEAFGGMEQYANWTNQPSISNFYTDSDMKDAFKDYVMTVVNRKNTFDDVLYRDNPAILGWDLANEPKDPGNPQSRAIQEWIEEMSKYVKKLDPNHLVMVGTEGFFGPSSPDRLHVNPYGQVYAQLAMAPYKYDAVCDGMDFVANQELDSIDVAVMHMYPDSWLACNESCKLDWTKDWVRHHLEAAASMGRPLLIGEFGSQKPIENRNKFLKTVYDALIEGISAGYPVAGSLIWLLDANEYPDYGGFGIHYNNKTTDYRPRPRLRPPNLDKMERGIKLRNRAALLECMESRASSYVDEDGHGWNDGWDETPEIIKGHAEDLEDIAHS